MPEGNNQIGAVNGVASPHPVDVAGTEGVEQIAVHADDVFEVTIEAVAQGEGAPNALNVGFPDFQQQIVLGSFQDQRMEAYVGSVDAVDIAPAGRPLHFGDHIGKLFDVLLR